MSEAAAKNIKSKQGGVKDDKLLDECIKANEQCYHDSCTKSIKVINIQCQLCTQYFCTTHALPEVHGCGQAARKAAAIPKVRKPTVEQHKQLENKLNKKLEKMKNERKKKGK